MNNSGRAPKKLPFIVEKISTAIRSNAFLYLLLLLVFAQGAWYAFNFVPSLFDEPTHLGFIEMYSERVNPFMSSQSESWDFLGEVTRNTSYLYYYLMSIPLRLFTFIGLGQFWLHDSFETTPHSNICRWCFCVRAGTSKAEL